MLTCDVCSAEWSCCAPGTSSTATPYEWDAAVVSLPLPEVPAVTRCLKHATWVKNGNSALET